MNWGGNIKHISLQLMDSFSFKVFFSLIASVFSCIFADDVEKVYILYALIVIDTITGTLIAWKKEDVCSKSFFKFAYKCMVYFLLIITGRLVDKLIPVSFAHAIIESFLGITEAISIMENLGKLGVPIPKAVMKKLNRLKEASK